MNERSPAVDRKAARRRFERAARTYGEASRLEEEAGSRLLDRLGYLRIAPATVLDAGSGTSREARQIKRRYPRADVLAVDFALGMLREGRRGEGLFRRGPSLPVCADLSRLPFPDGSVDFVWCNMALHWVAEPARAIAEFSRVLAPEGLLLFSTLGPDSLKELRAAAGEGRVHRFTDMHDIGDALIGAGLSAPVMEMEMLSIRYESATRLLDDLRRGGQTSARTDRPRGLSGRGFRERLLRSLDDERAVTFTATYELVFGHAWKARPRPPASARSIVQFRPRPLG